MRASLKRYFVVLGPRCTLIVDQFTYDSGRYFFMPLLWRGLASGPDAVPQAAGRLGQ
jgi:hypothetical protein